MGRLFDIHLLGFEDWISREDAVREMMRVFEIDEATAIRVVTGAPLVVKRNLTTAQAQAFYRALVEVGAEARIQRAAKPPSS